MGSWPRRLWFLQRFGGCPFYDICLLQHELLSIETVYSTPKELTNRINTVLRTVLSHLCYLRSLSPRPSNDQWRVHTAQSITPCIHNFWAKRWCISCTVVLNFFYVAGIEKLVGLYRICLAQSTTNKIHVSNTQLFFLRLHLQDGCCVRSDVGSRLWKLMWHTW